MTLNLKTYNAKEFSELDLNKNKSVEKENCTEAKNNKIKLKSYISTIKTNKIMIKPYNKGPNND